MQTVLSRIGGFALITLVGFYLSTLGQAALGMATLGV